MSISTIRIQTLLLVLVAGFSHAMNFDNRFIPLIQRPYLTIEGRPSHWTADFFVATANSAFGSNDIALIGIPELYGMYDQQNIAQSMVAAGFPNPLPVKYQHIEIPWNLTGKIQAQGFAFSYRQAFACHWSVGFGWLLMHVDAWQEYFLQKGSLFTVDEQLELDELRRSMQQTLGLEGPNSNQLGVGDAQVYIRWNNWWDYTCKFRHIDVGVRVGALLPTGVLMDINNPASIPFGGNGNYGLFGAIDLELELKEDWKGGFLVWMSKRLPRTFIHRMPVGKEPYIFGPIVGTARVNPGFTAVFSPYASLENVREGLGGRLQYTITGHAQDSWCDARANQTVPVNVQSIMDHSSWVSEYITLTVFYDFGKVKVKRSFEPVVTFAWNVPVSLLAARNVPKTNEISLGFEYSF